MKWKCDDIAKLPEIVEIQRKYVDCTEVVYTAVLGGVDRLRLREQSIQEGACYVAFLDNESLRAAKRLARPPRKVSPWSIEMISGTTLGSTLLTQRALKLLPHLLFRNARTTLWTDGKLALRSHAAAAVKKMFSDVLGLGAFRHFARNTLFEEFEELFKLAIHDCQAMSQQFKKYCYHAVPLHRLSLLESGVLFRNHSHEKLTEFSCIWFEEVAKGSKRDQLSLPWVLNHLNLTGDEFLHTASFRLRRRYFEFIRHVKGSKAQSDGKPELCRSGHETAFKCFGMSKQMPLV